MRARSQQRSVRRVAAVWLGALALLGASASAASASGGDWPQFGHDPAHSGVAAAETAITAGNVAQLQRTFTATLPDVADAPPVYRAGVSTASGVRDLLYVTTRGGATVALDASSGATIWSRVVGPGTCRINLGTTPCYTTSGPAVDPSGLYVYAYGLDGRAHRYAAGTGAEVTGSGWPELATSKRFDEKGSADLSIATSHGVSYLYVANGGYPGDRGDYQGHLTSINLSSGAQRVFNTLCSDQTVHFAYRATPDCPEVQSAVWSRASVVYDAGTDRVLLVTGNGRFSPSGHYWGDSVLAINPDGTGVNGGPLDSYTPTDYQALQDSDADLGSTAPALVRAPAGSTVTHLGVQSGKDARLRLLDVSNLSRTGTPGRTGGELQVIGVPQGGGVLTQPAAWTNPTDGSSWFFVSNSRGISGLKVTVTGGAPLMTPVWSSSTGGTSPVVAGRVLFYLSDAGARAVDPLTGTTLWAEPGTSIGLHWQSPIVANGHLYYPDGAGKLRAYALPAVTAHVGPIVGIASKCLDDYHSGTANGNPIQLYSCNGTAAQRWTMAANGSIQVLGRCLDDYHSLTTNGNKIQLYTCNGTAAQRWTVAADGSLRVLGKCLDDYHSLTTNGNKIQLYTCNGSAAQRWRTP